MELQASQPHKQEENTRESRVLCGQTARMFREMSIDGCTLVALQFQFKWVSEIGYKNVGINNNILLSLAWISFDGLVIKIKQIRQLCS